MAPPTLPPAQKGGFSVSRHEVAANSARRPVPDPLESPKQPAVRFNDRASAIMEQRGERGNAEPRGQVVEALRTAQAYVSTLNRQPPPPPPSGGAGCKENCCWRWLTAMLLKELQVLRRTVIDAREAYVEQERVFASLDMLPNEKDYSSFLEQHVKIQKEYQSLSSEFPDLQNKISTTREAVDSQNEEIRIAEAEVTRLQEVLRGEEAKQMQLQARLRASEKEIERTRKASEELQHHLEETRIHRQTQAVTMETVQTKLRALEADLNFQEKVAGRGAKPKKAATSEGSSARSPKPKK